MNDDWVHRNRRACGDVDENSIDWTGQVLHERGEGNRRIE